MEDGQITLTSYLHERSPEMYIWRKRPAVLDAAEEAKAPLPLASLVHDRLLSGIAKGRGTADWPAFTLLVSEDASLL
jgi:hypothetical protein